jgi:CubicO group peptidase (beta-lactamase class C family)
MRRLFAGTLLTLVGALPFVLSASPARAESLESQVDRYLRPLRHLEVFDGVVLIGRGGRVAFSKAYGRANVELGVANGPAQRFRIASVSKLFTALAVGRLSEQGRLRLDWPLSRLLPEFPGADSITIGQLLHHRAGIPNVNALPYVEDELHANSLDDLVRRIASLPLEFRPGSRTRYSNGGYAILAKVVELASGRPYPEYLRDEILAPLGLRDTGHERDGALLERRAYGYLPDPAHRHGLVPAPFQEMATKTGGGSLYSTAADLFRFARAVARDNVVRRSTWEAVLPIHDGELAASGRCPGFNSFLLRRLREDVTVVVLSNNYASGMLTEVVEGLAALALGRPCSPLAYRADVTVPPSTLAACAGRFRDPDGALAANPGDTLDVRLEGRDLVVRAGDAPLDVLVPQGPGRFLMRNAWCMLTFDSTATAIDDQPLYRSGHHRLTREPTR